jgi:hypothetical protein
LFLFSSCCFLAFGRFSLVPSEGPLINDQLRRGLLLFLRYFSTCSYPGTSSLLTTTPPAPLSLFNSKSLPYSSSTLPDLC